ncbi:hypothetical protein [Devosia chinhatensis]|uniref:hypothetical protein n=1 Tax=Devosia chinhatensis TaxID=429727 RepID=UPI0006968DDB|nr:hypothetical protein [Devosia chinhatensis]
MIIKNKRLSCAALALTLMTGLAFPSLAQDQSEIDFGDDSSEWANDGECDDPRFEGSAMAVELEDVDIGRDATDCRAAFEAGDITLVDPAADPAAEIDFGDDSSEWANDQECDDPRFAGPGMATPLDEENVLRDATDCRNAFADGEIWLADDAGDVAGGEETTSPTENGPAAAWLDMIASRIDFGDDSGAWPNDGECDDPDFVGPGANPKPSDDNRMADASDCRAAFLAGTVSLKSALADQPTTAFDYGDDTSSWANDGECDDWRFTGEAMAKKLSYEDVSADATDCRTLEEQGLVSIKPVFMPEYALGAPYDASGIDFGDDSSSYAHDDQCDDPRFEGPGTAYTLLDGDRMADATDCRAAFEAGTIDLRASER